MKTIKRDVLKCMDDIDVLIIPTASDVNDGILNMRYGIANEVNKMWGGIDSYFGKQIDRICGSGGLFWLMHHPELPIAIMQVKASLNHTDTSDCPVESLWHVRKLAEGNPDKTFGIVFPSWAINKNSESELELMPDNVVRYT